MTHQYSDQIAKHYAAFRPELHGLILRRLVPPGEHFHTGLDIGCGTGYSAIALAHHCDRVLGLEPSQPMLDKATIHPKISYVLGSGDDLSVVAEDCLDVISFAGSLFYTKTDRLKAGLLRKLAPDGVVLVYDFQVNLEDLIASLGVSCRSVASGYNHVENLCDWPEFTSEVTSTDQVHLKLSAQEASHLLLANSNRYKSLRERFPHANPFDCLTEQIMRKNKDPQVLASIYYARYSLSR
jgi:SAM-dependent methyltransferase